MGGDEVAQLRLAEAYEFSHLGLAIDLQLALMWYRKAAEGGDDNAQDRLGEIYERGELGLVAEEEVAPKWYQKANEGGEHYAQFRLAEAYEKGKTLGLKIDLQLALMWYREAAGRGNARA